MKKSTGATLLTGDEVLQALRLTPKNKPACLKNLRDHGLRAVRRGYGFVYPVKALDEFIVARTTDGVTTVAKAAKRLCVRPQWLSRQIRDGKLPGAITPDGDVLCDIRRIRKALETDQQGNAA